MNTILKVWKLRVDCLCVFKCSNFQTFKLSNFPTLKPCCFANFIIWQKSKPHNLKSVTMEPFLFQRHGIKRNVKQKHSNAQQLLDTNAVTRKEREKQNLTIWKVWQWNRSSFPSRVPQTHTVEPRPTWRNATFKNTKAVNTQLSNFQKSVHVGMWCSFWNVFNFVFVSHDIGSMLSNWKPLSD